MPGAYAHITLVNMLREPARLEQAGYPPAVIKSVLKWFKFCELGAVSPDYPYLALRNKGAQRWADLMHYDRTGEIIHAGIERLRSMDGDAAEKCTAWMLGYTSHVVMDTTVHPVVELKVGPYAQNKRAHRVCEMHQDAYVFQRLNLGGLRLAEHLDSGIGRCGDPSDEHRLDPDVASFWRSILEAVHAPEVAANPPDMDLWHRGFKRGVDKVAEEGGRLWPLARHVAMGVGLVYPGNDEIELAEYIEELATPSGPMSYDEVFDGAVANVFGRWTVIAQAVQNVRAEYLVSVGNWNLDTGRDDAGKLVFWQEAVA